MAMTDKAIARLLLLAIALTGCLLHAAESGDVSVRIGPTDIPRGNARGATDITLRNSRLAVAFAVETAPPWGVARGGIIDVAEVRDGKVAADRASLVDFMPNDWSSWPTTYQQVSIEKNTPAEAVIKTVRDWESVELVSTFQLKTGDNKIHMLTQMSNNGEKDYKDILSGYVLWPAGGFLFGVPGSGRMAKGKVEHALADWSAAYDENWTMGLHAPFADHIDNDSRDRYLQHSLKPGESRQFEAWLQVDARGELAPLVKTEIELKKLPAGRLSGSVTTSDGRSVDTAAVIVEKVTANGSSPYTWTVGHAGRYSLELPAGRYTLYASASAYAKSTSVTVELPAQGELQQDFRDLKAPGELDIQVLAKAGRQPLDARITIERGERPLIEYFGKTTFFTEIDAIGHVSLPVAPGDYRFRVAAAEGFRATASFLDVSVKPADRQSLTALVDVAANPAAKGWYGGDMHHHSDVLDGFTEPEFVFRSELAAGLDVTLLSDHDSVINNGEMARLAAQRGVPFIPATEFSPSWAHFNAYPLGVDKDIEIDPGRSTVQQIFSEARRMGADVIQVNHPYIAYGYFHSLENNAIPGGYSNAFDLVEIGSLIQNERTVEHTWGLWNAGQKAYFSAGSDVHDVWRTVSGAVRVYVHLDGELSIEKFIAALKQGHSYVSKGPLIYPDVMFGDTVQQLAGEPLVLNFSVQAVNGLKSVTLIERGQTIASQLFKGVTELSRLSFIVQPRGNTWYSLVVEDAAGRPAYSNPIWVSTASSQQPK